MNTPAEAAAHTVEFLRKHIVSQCFRIERQGETIKLLYGNGHIGLIGEAVALMDKMKKELARLDADYTAAKRRLDALI